MVHICEAADGVKMDKSHHISIFYHLRHEIVYNSVKLRFKVSASPAAGTRATTLLGRLLHRPHLGDAIRNSRSVKLMTIITYFQNSAYPSAP